MPDRLDGGHPRTERRTPAAAALQDLVDVIAALRFVGQRLYVGVID